MEENEKKPKASSKEVLMIIVVVVLAFGLTVAGIVYLTNFLIGEDKPAPQPTVETPVNVPEAPEDGGVVTFSNDNTTELPVQSVTPESTPATVPPVTAPVVTTPPVAPPASTPPVTTPPAQTKPQTATPATVPSTSPSKGAYQLQLVAFKSQQSANSEAQKYIKDYPDTYVMKADLGADGVWYRVRCCSSDSQDDLRVIKSEIEKKYKITPYIVRVK